MAKLTGKLNFDQQRLVVRLKAEYVRSPVIMARLKEEYGIDISKQGLLRYDPDTPEGRNLSDELAKLFRDTREAFRKNMDAEPANNLNYRQRERRLIYERVVDKNPVLASAILNDQARDAGEAYTNKIKMGGHDGGPVEVVNITAEERKAQLAEIFAGAKARKESASGDGPDTDAG